MEQTDFYTAALQKAAEASRRSIREEAGDYYENGLLFCGKCRTKKEHVISCGAFTKPVRCLCECAQKKREEEERERLRQIAAERLLERRRACFFTPRLCECTFSNSDGDTGTAGRAALRYAEAFSSIRGMEALYIETEAYGAVGRSLVLYDADRGCAISLSSQGSFETLEKIAEDLELVDTDIVSQNWDPDIDWGCLTFGGAKG